MRDRWDPCSHRTCGLSPEPYASHPQHGRGPSTRQSTQHRRRIATRRRGIVGWAGSPPMPFSSAWATSCPSYAGRDLPGVRNKANLPQGPAGVARPTAEFAEGTCHVAQPPSAGSAAGGGGGPCVTIRGTDSAKQTQTKGMWSVKFQISSETGQRSNPLTSNLPLRTSHSLRPCETKPTRRHSSTLSRVQKGGYIK